MKFASVIALFLFASYSHALELTPSWSLNGFEKPESVIYDSNSESYYVSNIVGMALDKDNNGYISRLDKDGNRIQQKWIEGMSAPKGMAIHNRYLYVSDIDTLVKINLTTATIEQRYIADGAKFLNDVAVDKDGYVYVSDMFDNRIYRLANGQFDSWLASDELQSPNGLTVINNQLIVGSWGVLSEGFATSTKGHMLRINLQTKAIQSQGPQSEIGNIDGVEFDGNKGYWITDWMAGRVIHVTDHKAELILQLKQGSADIGIRQDIQQITVPMMLEGTVHAYQWK